MLILNMLYSMVFNKCSRCHQGDVFVSKNPYNLSKLFELHKNCSNCNLEYMPEPSFFLWSLICFLCHIIRLVYDLVCIRVYPTPLGNSGLCNFCDGIYCTYSATYLALVAAYLAQLFFHIQKRI